MRRAGVLHESITPLLHYSISADPRVFFHYITVGHSRDVITNCAMQSLLLDSSHRAFAQSIGIGKVRFKNTPQHLASALVHFRDTRMVIDILIQKFPERAVRLGQFIAVTNKRRGLPAHVVCALHARFRDRFRAGRNQVVHFAINDVANNQLVQVRFARVLVTRDHCAMTVAPDVVLLQSRQGQDFENQARHRGRDCNT